VTYNILSRQNIKSKIEKGNLATWIEEELKGELKSTISIVKILIQNIEEYVRWPKEPVLLWNNCDRIPPEGEKVRYHKYPDELKKIAKKCGIYLDGRGNGPAIAAFGFGGGVRPDRSGNKNKWHIHHIYSGKFPYFGKNETTHAVKSKIHFSQSAGLCSLHPILDSICDEYASISWFLRFESYNRFAYDPDGVFSNETDQYGFDKTKMVKVNLIHEEI
jgi:hypothetical protein